MSLLFSDVSVDYGRGNVLKNVNLEIHKGEKVGILGPAGAGKTTLLKISNGILPEYISGKVTGEITVEGLKVNEHQTMELSRHIGIVYADPFLSIVALTVEDDVAFGLQCIGLETEEIQRRVKNVLGKVRLAGYETRNTSTLSGGEMQALSIAGIVAMEPPILALDDPVSMLDPIGKRMVLDVINSAVVEREGTLIISEGGADIEYTVPLFDRLVVLYKGEIIDDGPVEEILSNNDLMNKIRIKPPQVTELAQRLEGPRPYPINFEQAVPYFKELFENNGLVRAHIKDRKIKKGINKGEKPILSVRNLHKVFPSLTPVHALNNINFDIYPGEFVGLIGQNGAGKSTLALTLTAINNPTDELGNDVIPEETKVVIDNMDVTGLMRKRLFKHSQLIEKINYVFQNPDDMLFQDSVKKEIAYGPTQLGFSEEEIEKRVDEALALYDLEDLADEDIMYLTKDFKTFVATASVVALKPKILLIDEPTTGLDHVMGEKVMEVLDRLRRESGCTIITITHDMNLVAKYTDRCMVLNKGKIILDGKTEDVFKHDEILNNIYISPPQVTRLGQTFSDLDFPPNILSVDEFLSMVK